MDWYALYCRSNLERIVVGKLASEGVEAFYPHVVEKKPAHRKGGEIEVDRKFFPGYTFARFDLRQGIRIVADIPQVVSILGWGREPVPISEFEVAAVRRIVNTPMVKAITSCGFVTAGDRVRVMRGPLAGLEGFVVYGKNTARVIVTVEMLHRSISAEVDIDTLERVRERAPASTPVSMPMRLPRAA